MVPIKSFTFEEQITFLSWRKWREAMPFFLHITIAVFLITTLFFSYVFILPYKEYIMEPRLLNVSSSYIAVPNGVKEHSVNTALWLQDLEHSQDFYSVPQRILRRFFAAVTAGVLFSVSFLMSVCLAFWRQKKSYTEAPQIKALPTEETLLWENEQKSILQQEMDTLKKSVLRAKTQLQFIEQQVVALSEHCTQQAKTLSSHQQEMGKKIDRLG